MFKKNQEEESNFWISYTDLITGFMIVFIVIAFWLYSQDKDQGDMLQENKQLKKQVLLFKDSLITSREAVKNITDVYKNYRGKIYADLKSKLGSKLKEWDADLGEDLSVRFNNSEVLFNYGEDILKARFQSILKEFLPIYFSTLLQQDNIVNYVSEIRIEGHTAGTSGSRYDPMNYVNNHISLSQRRANAVLRYFMSSTYYRRLKNTDKEKLIYLITSNGLAFGRTIDENGKLTFDSGEPSSIKSRRVEFRIITKDQKLLLDLEKIIKK